MLRVEGHTFRVLVATTAANIGIDQPLCVYVLRVGIPRCITTLLQERGRLVRKDGMTGTFALISSWDRWILLLLSVMVPEASGPGEIPDHSYDNSSIDSQTPERQ